MREPQPMSQACRLDQENREPPPTCSISTMRGEPSGEGTSTVSWMEGQENAEKLPAPAERPSREARPDCAQMQGHQTHFDTALLSILQNLAESGKHA